jgi:hypothetical protein
MEERSEETDALERDVAFAKRVRIQSYKSHTDTDDKRKLSRHQKRRRASTNSLAVSVEFNIAERREGDTRLRRLVSALWSEGRS